eukprot:Rmarinus@m.23748
MTSPLQLEKSRSVGCFEKLNRIGEGTYGVVYRALEKESGKLVALKKLRMEDEKNGVPVTAVREIRLLKTIRHPNIVQLKEVVVGSNTDSVFLVFEYCDHDLANLMDNVMRKPFSDSEVKCILLQVLRAVDYLHDRWITHRDLKMSNLLYTNQGEVKLCDFGLARNYSDAPRTYSPLVVTLWYRAPEVLFADPKILGKKDQQYSPLVYTKAVDMWSVGCIFGELLTQKPLMCAKTEVGMLEQLFTLLGAPNDKIWPGFSKTFPGIVPHATKYKYSSLRQRVPRVSDSGFDLLSRLLTYDPMKRLTTKEALRVTSILQGIPTAERLCNDAQFPVSPHQCWWLCQAAAWTWEHGNTCDSGSQRKRPRVRARYTTGNVQ